MRDVRARRRTSGRQCLKNPQPGFLTAAPRLPRRRSSSLSSPEAPSVTDSCWTQHSICVEVFYARAGSLVKSGAVLFSLSLSLSFTALHSTIDLIVWEKLKDGEFFTVLDSVGRNILTGSVHLDLPKYRWQLNSMLKNIWRKQRRKKKCMT